jgi:hypothetical protein
MQASLHGGIPIKQNQSSKQADDEFLIPSNLFIMTSQVTLPLVSYLTSLLEKAINTESNPSASSQSPPHLKICFRNLKAESAPD